MGRIMSDTSTVNRFRAHVNDLLDTIESNTGPALDQAADELVRCIQDDGIIHVAGAGGHSQIPAMEMFYRAGGLANVSIIFGPGLGLFDGKPCLERVSGMGGYTMAYHDVRTEDVVIVCNYYGMNASTIDLALAAKKRARIVIGVTSSAFAENTPDDFTARHPSGKNLSEIADILLDTHTSKDEQTIPVPGVSQAVGVASSIAACYLIQLLVIRTVEKAAEAGIDPPLWMCANIPGGDKTNEQHIKKYMPRMRHLYPEGETFSSEKE